MSAFFNSLKNLATGTAHVAGTTKYKGGDMKMDMSITPQPGENGFAQWLDAMKMVARLSEGIPHEFRKKDLHRTGCSLFCGAAGRDNQKVLRRVLLGYARWNKSVGYCQGLNVLAALILQVTDRTEVSAVKVLIYLIEGVLPEDYFAENLRGLSVDMAVFGDLLRMKLPKLSKHLESLQNNIKNNTTGSSYEPPLINVFTMQWFLTLFCHCLPQHTVLRVWDLIFLEGNEILLKTALAIWEGISDRIITVTSTDEFYSIMGVLTREMLEFTDTNILIKAIVNMGTLHRIDDLREKHRYNITPWARTLSDNEESETEDEDKLPVAATIFAVPRRITKGARVRQTVIPPSSQTMNDLFFGKSALISAKTRRLRPATSSIPSQKTRLIALHCHKSQVDYNSVAVNNRNTNTFMEIKRESSGAGENEPKCLRPLEESLTCRPYVRKQSTDSDSTSTELCDEHGHSSDSEDQASLSDNPDIKSIDGKHPRSSDLPTNCPSSYSLRSMEKDSSVDEVNECENEKWMKVGCSSSIIKIADNIRSLSADNNLIEIKTCIDKDNLKNEKTNEILKSQDKEFMCSKSSVLKNIEDKFSNCSHSSPIETSFQENDNDTPIDEHYDSAKEPSISNALVNSDVLLENSSILIGSELSSERTLNGIFIPTTLSKDNAIIDSYSSSNIKKSIEQTVGDSNYDIINLSPMSSVVDRKVMLTDLELLTNKITESNEQINDILQGKNTFIHNQTEPVVIPNYFRNLNVDEGRQQDDHKLNKIFCNSKESAISDSNGFFIMKNSHSQRKQNCYNSKHYSVNGNLNRLQLVLTQSDNVHSRLTVDSSLFENSSRLKVDGSTSSTAFNLDFPNHEVNVFPNKSITESLRNSLDNHIEAENAEKIVNPILQSPVKGITNKFHALNGHQNDFFKSPCKPSPVISPFFPIIESIKKSPSPIRTNEMEKNGIPFENILPTRSTSLKEYDKSNFYDRGKLLSFSQTTDTQPIHDLRTECSNSANTSATQFVDLWYCGKQKNEESSIMDLDVISSNYKRLPDKISTDNISISQIKSDNQSKYLNTSKKMDHSTSQLCGSKFFEQNYHHCNKDLSELQISTPMQGSVTTRNISRNFFENSKLTGTQSSIAGNKTDILTSQKKSDESNDLNDFKERCEYSLHDFACQLSEDEVEFSGSNVLTNPSKSYAIEPKIQMDEESDSFLIKYAKNKDTDESSGKIECKLGVWTKVQPRKKGENGRRDSCDRALKIIQENSAILHKILTCQAKKCLPDLEEISQEITISPINEEISKIFSPILEHIGLNEYEINEELANINFSDFNPSSGIEKSEFDKKINVEHSQLSLTDDKEVFHFDEDRISITNFLYSKEPLIHNKMDEELSRMIDECERKSPNNLCLFSEFSKKSPNDIEALNICSCSSNEFFQQFSKNLEHQRDYHFFKDTYSHPEKFPDCIDNLKEYSMESICPRAEDLFLNSDIDIYRELEKLDKMSPHDSVRSNLSNMIQESVSPLGHITESSARSKSEIPVKCYDEFEKTFNFISPDISHPFHEPYNVQVLKSIPFEFSSKQFSHNTRNKSWESSFEPNEDHVTTSENYEIKNQDEILLHNSYKFRVCYEDKISPNQKICTDISSLYSCKTDQEAAVHLNKSPNHYDNHLNDDKQNTSDSSMISPKKTMNVDTKFNSHLSILQTASEELSADYEYSKEDDFTLNSINKL
ncbi:uncharacterized protein LOC130663026 isoform X2 [Microplitis mediator]|uniref:uncharacterized protein LOC130663026 isoform X2 n=1 Tax=Microplitis mediator TaxID=375433 RepID=UPI00255621B2|nr:uncharacterized protein LOC130663026 isoform X2 [Microplitis mediator]